MHPLGRGVVTFASNSYTITSLTNAGTFTLSGGTLTVNGTVQNSGSGTFAQTGGTLE